MHQSPAGTYKSLIESQAILADEEQALAISELDRLWRDLVTHKQAGILKRLLGKGYPTPRGIYLWGSVGRGKTWMMDLFYDSLPFEEKQRIHFHRFMARVHGELKVRNSERDPLTEIARQWAKRCRVLCFDELFVSDIADAMLLGGLLEALLENGVVLVATSNVRPDDLYANGLQRARFLPAIALLNEKTTVLNVGGDLDYRLRILKRSEIYHHPLEEAADASLGRRFTQFCGGSELSPVLDINGRQFEARHRGDGVIWFDFQELCEKPRSAADYIEIGRAFNTVLLSNLPAMDDKTNDPARRFVALIDEFYDRNVKLLVTAETAIEEIYTGSRLAFEFKRTASRLVEMQSHEYLARPHLP